MSQQVRQVEAALLDIGRCGKGGPGGAGGREPAGHPWAGPTRSGVHRIGDAIET